MWHMLAFLNKLLEKDIDVVHVGSLYRSIQAPSVLHLSTH